jgi:simple sugar transport system ATP-binding protein
VCHQPFLNKQERMTLLSLENAIELRDITKTFGDVSANSHVSLDIRWGEILSLLGENGSGKTSLMNILAGIYFPDSGQVYVNGEEVSIRSPKDAFGLGIGMIHQHLSSWITLPQPRILCLV